MRLRARRLGYRLAMIGGLGAALTLSTTGTAQAAISDLAYASNTYAYAGMSFYWNSSWQITGANLIVADWECDGHQALGKVKVLYTNGTSRTYGDYYDGSGCDLGDNTNHYLGTISAPCCTNIQAVKTIACGDYWPWDICAEGGWVDNPYS